jgi:uncharacterized delta-60 repeat protein
MLRYCLHIAVLVASIGIACSGKAQAPLTLDPSFQFNLNEWYVSSALPLDDGKILLSGQIKFPGEFWFRGSVRLSQDGSIDTTFPQFPLSAGQGKLTKWQDKIYVEVGQEIRRLDGDGLIDPEFILMSDDALFSSLQGGDYHVYPDGSILLSGLHNLDDTARGFVGLYNLIWFTNTGHLDTTKIHRKGNGAIYEIEQQPDGKFLCSGACTIYDGQPVRKVFRVQPGGALDTTFDSGITWGRANVFMPLTDGRAYMVGISRREGFPDDTLRIVRLLPNGALDDSFNYQHAFGLGELENALGLGATILNVQPWGTDAILLTGEFQFVNGAVRRGICVLDTTGQLRPEFDGAGVNTFVYQNTITGVVAGTFLTPDNMLYVYGAYHGYTDGTTNDPDQRFITRLYGPDLTTGVAPEPLNTEAELRVHPNPGTGAFVLELLLDGPATAQLLDASGRVVHSQVLTSGTERHNLHTGLLPGAYMLRVRTADGRTLRGKVVVE